MRHHTRIALAGAALALAVTAAPKATAAPQATATQAVTAQHTSGLAGPAGRASAPPPRQVSLPGLTGSSYTVTLPTGDQVTLTSSGSGSGSGSYVVSAEPPRAGGDVAVTALTGPDGVKTLYAFPTQASALVRTGLVDPRLFDVRWLASHGDTGPAGTIPVTFEYTGARPATPPGATVTASTANTVTMRISVTSAAQFWTALVGPVKAGVPAPAVQPRLADGIVRAWPAGEPPRAQAVPAGQRLYNVTENVTFTRSVIGGRSTLDIGVPLIIGVTGSAVGQMSLPTGASCLDAACTQIQLTYSVPDGIYTIEDDSALFYAGERWQLLDIPVPQLVVAGNVTVSVNADKAVHYTVRAPRATQAYETILQTFRGYPNGDREASFAFTDYGSASTDLWIVPAPLVTVGSYHSTVSWVLGQPPVTAAVVAPENLALHAYYPEPTDVDPYAIPKVKELFARFSGTSSLPVVDAGSGTPQDFSGLDVHGKLVLIHATPADGTIVRAQMDNAARAGAAGVIGVPPADVYGDSTVPFQPEWVFDENPRPVLPFAEIPASDASVLSGLLKKGPVKLTVSDSGPAPYLYNLAFSSEGQPPAAPDYSVTDDQLDQVDASYQAAQPAPLQLTASVLRPDDHFVAGSSVLLSAPVTLHTYYGPADPETVWYRQPMLWQPDGSFTQIKAWDVSDRTRNAPETWWDRSEVPGAPTLAQDVFASQPGRINGSGLFSHETACSFCRQGDLFFPQFELVSGQSPRLDDSLYQFDPAQSHLYLNGSEIPPSDFHGLTVYQMPPQQGQYRLTTSGGNLDTDWTFSSAHPAQEAKNEGYYCSGSFFNLTDPCAAVPVILLRYDASAGPDGSIAAGGERRMRISTYDQVTTQPMNITSLKFWTSTDGGTTWRQAHVSKSDDGTFVADYSIPALSSAGGTLSIRAQASDAAGDTISQTYYDDYPLTAR